MIGYVKWFNPLKGYGFIMSGKKQYFVFYSAIQMNGYRKLEPGQKVIFKVKNWHGHQQAHKVKPFKAR